MRSKPCEGQMNIVLRITTYICIGMVFYGYANSRIQCLPLLAELEGLLDTNAILKKKVAKLELRRDELLATWKYLNDKK